MEWNIFTWTLRVKFLGHIMRNEDLDNLTLMCQKPNKQDCVIKYQDKD